MMCFGLSCFYSCGSLFFAGGGTLGRNLVPGVTLGMFCVSQGVQPFILLGYFYPLNICSEASPGW